VKSFFNVDKFIDCTPEKYLPLLRRCNQQTVSSRISGPAETRAEPYKANLVEQDCGYRARLVSKDQDNRTAVTGMLTTQEVIDTGGKVVLLIATRPQFIELSLD
jgi:hypothetical protein